MKESNYIVEIVFSVIILFFCGCGIIDCIWNIVHHWNISIPAIFENLTIGYILRIIWWFFSLFISVGTIYGLYGDVEKYK